MENVTNACGEHLVANLSPETCLGIRAINGIAANASFAERVDEYIQQQVSLHSCCAMKQEMFISCVFIYDVTL